MSRSSDPLLHGGTYEETSLFYKYKYSKNTIVKEFTVNRVPISWIPQKP